MDLLTALMILVGCARHDAPLVMPKGSVQTIPDPLPYVIDSAIWGPK